MPLKRTPLRAPHPRGRGAWTYGGVDIYMHIYNSVKQQPLKN
ncbi:MAG: hypothetical protein QXG48_05840 [Thermofilaceae archaeon]